MSDGEVERTARTLLCVRGGALEEVLAERGNELLADRWAMCVLREGIVIDIGALATREP